jgi:hypothetical protein
VHDVEDLLDNHRGLYLIRQFAHDVTTDRDGATIEMGFSLWATSLAIEQHS